MMKLSSVLAGAVFALIILAPVIFAGTATTAQAGKRIKDWPDMGFCPGTNRQVRHVCKCGTNQIKYPGEKRVKQCTGNEQ
jgi:hypothetical protein